MPKTSAPPNLTSGEAEVPCTLQAPWERRLYIAFVQQLGSLILNGLLVIFLGWLLSTVYERLSIKAWAVFSTEIQATYIEGWQFDITYSYNWKGIVYTRTESLPSSWGDAFDINESLYFPRCKPGDKIAVWLNPGYPDSPRYWCITWGEILHLQFFSSIFAFIILRFIYTLVWRVWVIIAIPSAASLRWNESLDGKLTVNLSSLPKPLFLAFVLLLLSPVVFIIMAVPLLLSLLGEYRLSAAFKAGSITVSVLHEHHFRRESTNTHRTVQLADCDFIRINFLSLYQQQLELCMKSGEVIPIVRYITNFRSPMGREGAWLLTAWLNRKLGFKS